MSVEERIQHLAKLAEQLKHPDAGAAMTERNHFTRLVDASIEWAREHFPAIHKLGAWMLAVFMYLYVRLLGSTIRLVELNHRTWPDVASPCVLALWHGSAPSFLAAIARLRPRIPMVIMVSPNPRGDSLAVMFRWLGVEVVRGDHAHAGRQALIQLAHELEKGKCTLLTVDGGGPAKFARPGAVMLSVATGRPLLAVATDCAPAFVEPRKWDSPRNPLPFSDVALAVSQPVRLPAVEDAAALERARSVLQDELERVSIAASRSLRRSRA